ncbi:immune inhibitor A domain-containing protein [Angustibacter luteus]|uniref:Immune inhibitor A domain-containing protein n=1 Tax=Angustibacter luteus TaxID=658456 RepID=A0ABW1JCW3_9ACTN
MRKVTAGVVSLVLASGAGVAIGLAPASAAPPVNGAPSKAKSPTAVSDELSNPQESKRRDLREAALNDVLAGKAKPITKNGSTYVKVGKEATSRKKGQKVAAKTKDQYVELAREKSDKIFVILAEFGNERGTDIDPRYGDVDTDPTTAGPTTFEGPLHNAIPEPNRAQDNSTVWQADYNKQHYQDLYFGKGENSVASYYKKQSSGRYTVSGEVTDWVKVKYNEARYGRSNGFPCAGIVCANTWDLVRDAVNQWVVDQKAAGRTTAQIKADLASYDQWDRYDYDGDGNFNEPDGYLDHFQIVHAGGDQADGDPQQGEDAIWSHRWAVQTGAGSAGPSGNLRGGAQIGDTGLWVGDYTIQPENGGLSVFTHEFGHDLGLPDHYDTNGGDNGVEYWNLMAQSRLNAPGEALGTRPGDLSAWDKLQLGWLDYEIVPAGTKRTLDLGPHEYNSKKAQAVVVPLPAKKITTDLGAPASGTQQWFSGQGDDLNTTLARTVTLAAGTSTLSAKARWNIEDCGPDQCDYAFVEVNDGSGWVSVKTSASEADDPGDVSNGIDGVQATYAPLTADLSAYAGKTVQVRYRYTSDGAQQGQPDADLGWSGLFLDDITLTSGGATVFTDGAETLDPAWTAAGFSRVGASVTNSFANYYIASNRSYVSYDRWLESGPYNFGFANTKPDFVEHFKYQQGLLVNYWDTSQSDNNTSQHNGEGLVLPIDAHPAPIYRIDGLPWRSRVQVYDAPFSLQKADSFTLHINGQASYIRGQNAVPTFDDRKSYWSSVIPQTGVKVPNAGVKIQVTKQDGTSMKIKISSTK